LPELRRAVAAVICTLNEEATLPDVIRAVKPYVDEVVVMDGHSTDRTRELAAEEGARVELDSGRGKGAAIRQAIDTADTDVLVFVDADGSHVPEDIPKLVKPIREGRADLVIGCRMRGGSDELSGDWSGFIRLTGQNLLMLMVNWQLGTHLTDMQNGFRAVSTAAMRKLGLRSTIATIEEEMTIKALRLGLSVANIPSHEFRRKSGYSKIPVLKWSAPFVWVVLRELYAPRKPLPRD
jgi:dolichol-phosphate mannosyltransferase